ncbi:MAG: hypothetical protein NTU44_17610, partial [Bacteroidetes bacterium]|nr:hypothetical protein [Bacteroidota bacterium]
MKTNKKIKNPATMLLVVFGLFLLMGTTLSAKTIKEELDAAKKAKKSVFLVVVSNGVQPDNSIKIAQQAQKKVKESMVLTMNRDDAANKEVVTTLGLGSAPVPLIMVIGMNGIAAGGLQEKEATVDKLVNMVPSPKKVEALGYLNDKKPVFIIAYRKSFTDRAKVVDNCKSAITQLKGQAAYVEVDLDDPAEKSLLEQVGADYKTKATQILVFNSAGKNTGNFTGVTEPGKLVTA